MIGGRYEILGLLGTGGMGTVYRARDVELDELVALKVLRRDLVDKPAFLERFRREVKLARRVTHRNVARTFDIGEHEGEKFLTMELVEGVSLSSLLHEQGALPALRVMEIAVEICAGLAAAHDAGVVHRDLKPDNVLICRDGRVVITDFGIARALASGSDVTQGMLVGTPTYMAPEQVQQSGAIDERTDIYALGTMAYEMLTGKPPFTGETVLSIAIARLTSPPPDPRVVRPDVPEAIARAVLRAMAREPADRFPSARELAAALSSVTLPPASGALQDTLISAREPPSVTAVEATTKSIAVLPFRNAGPPEDEYLADGLTDDLIDALSMTAGLRVRSRSGVVRVATPARDPREIGRELDVHVVAEGTLRRTGDQLRVTTRLISVADGFQLWACRFDRPATQVLAIGDEAARAIASALTAGSPPTRAEPGDPVALDLYLRARHAARRVGRKSSTQAVELFERALARAPDDVAILAAAALSYTRAWFFTGDTSFSQTARAYAERAVANGPGRGETHVSLAIICHYSGDPCGAVRELARALRLAPMLVDVHELLGRILLEAGDTARGMKHVQLALLFEPSLLAPRWDMARAHALRGDWDRAQVTDASGADEAEVRFGSRLHELRMAGWRRDRARMDELLQNTRYFDLDDTLFATVREALARGVVPRFPLAPGLAQRRVCLFHQVEAEFACYLGEHARALEPLAQAADHQLFDIAWFEGCPLFAPLRGDPTFEELRARVRRRADEVLHAFDTE